MPACEDTETVSFAREIMLPALYEGPDAVQEAELVSMKSLRPERLTFELTSLYKVELTGQFGISGI